MSERLPDGQRVRVYLRDDHTFPAIGEVLMHDVGDNAVHVLLYPSDYNAHGEIVVGEHLVEAINKPEWEVK